MKWKRFSAYTNETRITNRFINFGKRRPEPPFLERGVSIICELRIAFLQCFSYKRIQVGPGVPCWSMHQLNLPMTKSNFMSLQSKCRLQLNKFITKTKLVTDEPSPTRFLTLNHGCASASFAVIRSSWFGSSIIFIRSFACSETPSHCLGRIWIEVGILTSH